MYNPADHKAQNQPFGVGTIPLNAKTLYYDTTKLVYRQFQNVAELESYFAIQFKTPDFESIVNTDGTLNATTGKITGGTNDAYWFPNGATSVLKKTNIDISLYYTSAQVDEIIDVIQEQLTGHINDTENPHSVTKSQVGLGNVDNTSDINKPVSIAQTAAILVETQRAMSAEALLQPKTDLALNTAAKDIPYAINEVLTYAYALKPKISSSVSNSGQNFVTSSDLINQTVSKVFRQGVVYKVGDTASDLNLTVLFDTTLGKITFESELSPSEVVWAEYSGIDGGNATLNALIREQDISNATIDVIEPINKIDVTKLVSGFYYKSAVSAIVANTDKPTYGRTDFIPVQPSGVGTYAGTAKLPSGGYFDINKQPIIGLNIGTPTSQPGGEYLINHPSDIRIAYLVLNYNNTLSTSNLQYNNGSVRLAYVPYTPIQYKLKIQDKVNEVIGHGDNYADKSTFVNGTAYSSGGGGVSTDTRSRRQPPIFLDAGQYTISGTLLEFFGNIYSSSNPILSNRVSKINEPDGTRYTEMTFTVPSSINGGAWVGMNIERANSGFTPTGEYDNTFMLAKGTNKVYQAFVGNGVPGSKIYGDIPNYTKTVDFLSVKGAVDAIISLDYNKYYDFNGTTSKAVLPASVTLDAIGDYIEFTARFTGTGFTGLGMIGITPGSANKLGFYRSGQIGLRGNVSSDAYAIWNIPGGTGTFKTYKVEVLSGGWQLSVDGVAVSTIAKLSPLVLNNIGNAYPSGGSVWFKGGIISIKIHNGTQDFDITDLSVLPNAVDVVGIYEDKNPGGGGSVTYPKILYSYDPTGGYKSVGVMHVYQSYGDGSNYYLRLDVEYCLDPSIRSDLYRIRDNEVCTYDLTGNAMTGTGLKLLHTSENEDVIQVAGMPDHTGGYHGDEIKTFIQFFADYQPVSISSVIQLTEANEFHYVQRSNLLDVINPSDVNVMQKTKTTRFENFGYSVESIKTFLSTVDVSIAYAGLFCTDVDQSEKAYTDNGIVITALRNGANHPTIIEESYSNILNYYNETTKLGAKATAVFTKVIRSGQDQTLSINLGSILQGWDRSTDFKFYLKKLTPGNFFIGDYLGSLSSISFYRKP